MLSLKSQQDAFRLLLPKEFIAPEIEEKYTNIINRGKSFIRTPIDLINESIQSVDVLGFSNAVITQDQPNRAQGPLIKQERVEQNNLLSPNAPVAYRAPNSPFAMMDMTFNVTFRHTLGYLNYFILFENFWFNYSRDRTYDEMCQAFYIELLNQNNVVYSRIKIGMPIMSGMDMLSFDYKSPVASAGTFKTEFKYSNFDFEMIDTTDSGFSYK